MQEFVTYIAKQLVDHPEQVILDHEEKDGKVILKLQVGQADNRESYRKKRENGTGNAHIARRGGSKRR